MSEETIQVENKTPAPAPAHSGHRRRGEGGGRQRRGNDGNSQRSEENPYIEKLVYVNRTTKVVKGGRRFSFSALLVLGDGKGRVGYGFGKANEVADAIRKATEAAKKAMVKISLHNSTIPHAVSSEYCGGQVLLRPASPGTGVIAGGGVRAVLEAVGVKDVLTKAQGSHNPGNIVKATLKALGNLRSAEQIRSVRGLNNSK